MARVAVPGLEQQADEAVLKSAPQVHLQMGIADMTIVLPNLGTLSDGHKQSTKYFPPVWPRG